MPVQCQEMSKNRTNSSYSSQQPAITDDLPLLVQDKRKRGFSEEGKSTPTSAPKKTRRSLNKKEKDKPAEDTGINGFYFIIDR